MKSYELQGEEPLHVFNWTESEQLSSAIVLAISQVSGEDPMGIEPLYHVIDPDSLNSLFASTRSPRLSGRVQFNYHGYRIVIKADGRGSIYEQKEQGVSA